MITVLQVRMSFKFLYCGKLYVVNKCLKPGNASFSFSFQSMTPSKYRQKLTSLDQEIINRHKQAILEKKESYEDPITSYSVFTRIYHLNRGECCGSACRHVSNMLLCLIRCLLYRR